MRSPKTPHHVGHDSRLVPLFPEVLPYLREVFEQAEPGETYWLSISMATEGGEWGWQTSPDIQGNPSVFWDSYDFWAPHPTWSLRNDITWKWTP